MKKILLILIATTFLSSFSGCGDGEQPKPFEDFEYNVELYKTESPDTRELFEVKCFKRKYRVWLDLVGAKEKFIQVPSVECEKLFGFKPVAKGNLWALMEYARKEANACIQEREQQDKALPGILEK